MCIVYTYIYIDRPTFLRRRLYARSYTKRCSLLSRHEEDAANAKDKYRQTSSFPYVSYTIYDDIHYVCCVNLPYIRNAARTELVWARSDEQQEAKSNSTRVCAVHFCSAYIPIQDQPHGSTQTHTLTHWWYIKQYCFHRIRRIITHRTVSTPQTHIMLLNENEDNKNKKYHTRREKNENEN